MGLRGPGVHPHTARIAVFVSEPGMLKLHHLERSRSQRVLWMLEELQQPYELLRYARDPKTLLAPASLRAIHPLGKSPVLEDDGRVIVESGAILEYLVDRYDAEARFAPRDESERLRYRQWMHYAEGSLMPPLLLTLVFARLKKAPMPFFARPIARGIADRALRTYVGPQVQLHLDYIESELGRSRWFCGERFTAADVQMSFPLEAASTRADAAGRPRIHAFLERIRERPAYRRATERGGAPEPLT